MQTKRILFMNFGGLGDEILFLPTIQAVKKDFPNSHITLALEERSQGIISLTDVIDETLFANIKESKFKELLKLLFKIWKGKYDIVISSGSNKFIAVYLFLTFVKKRYGYNSGILSKLLLTKAVDLNKKQYAVLMYGDLVKSIVNSEIELPYLSIKKKPIISNSVLVHPGVSQMSLKNGMIKTIEPNQWAEVIEKLADTGKRVLLIGGKDDKDCIETIQKIVPPEKYENLYGSTKNLKELAELISSAEKFLCSDSAPLHIATALGVQTYVIFGSTDYKKLVPQSEKVVPIKIESTCPLQPCLWEKRQKTCDELHCLKIPTEQIVQTVLN